MPDAVAHLHALENDPGTPTRRCLVATPLTDYRPKAVDWLWRDRIPAGELTVLAGDGGLGKSTLCAHLAAEVTRGAVTGTTGTRDVGVVLGEDDPARVLSARYRAAGADMGSVAIVAADEGMGDELLSLPEDLPMLREFVALHRPDLLIVDPLTAHMSGAIDSHRDGGKGGLRAILNPLSHLAQTYGTTVVVCVHLNKGSGPSGQRIGGSAAIRNAARNVLMLAEHPEARQGGDDDGRRVLGHEKSNYGPLQPSLEVTVTEAPAIGDGGLPLLRSDGSPATTSTVAVGDESDVDYRDAIRSASTDEHTDNGGDRDAMGEAVAFLYEELADGPMPSRRLDAAAADAGIARRTLMRARASLGVKAAKGAAGWTVSLPDAAGTLDIVGGSPVPDGESGSADESKDAKAATAHGPGTVGMLGTLGGWEDQL